MSTKPDYMSVLTFPPQKSDTEKDGELFSVNYCNN